MLKIRKKPYRPVDKGGSETFAHWDDRARLRMDADFFVQKRALFNWVWDLLETQNNMSEQEVHDFLLDLGDKHKERTKGIAK